VPATLYTQEDSWYSFLLEAESIPGLEGLGKLKNSMTSLGIKPVNVYTHLKSKETRQTLGIHKNVWFTIVMVSFSIFFRLLCSILITQPCQWSIQCLLKQDGMKALIQAVSSSTALVS
jgi:hypothetical protein